MRRRRVAIVLSVAALVSLTVWAVWMTTRLPRVVFKGVILDQHGRGAGGVRVLARLTVGDDYWRGGLPQPDIETVAVQTDGSGQFEVTGRYRSIHLELSPHPQYVLPPDSETRRFFAVRDGELEGLDSQKRYCYPVWQRGAVENLLQERIKLSLNPVRAVGPLTRRIDLLRRRAYEGTDGDADLILVIHPMFTRTEGRPDFTLEMYSVDGGLQRTEQVLPFEAPVEGYQADWKYDSRLDRPVNATHVEARERFYIRSRNGTVHTAMKLHAISLQSAHVVLSLDYVTNPNRSRNLDPDSSKRIFVKE